MLWCGSKTYCGYCNRVKDLLKQLGAAHKVIELDTESEFTFNAVSIYFMFARLCAFFQKLNVRTTLFCCPSLGLCLLLNLLDIF